MDFVRLITQEICHAFAEVVTLVFNVHLEAQIVPIHVRMEEVVCQFIQIMMDIYVTVYLVLLGKTAKVLVLLLIFLILFLNNLIFI